MVGAAGATGVTLHALYKNHNLQAGVARQVAKDLVQAGHGDIEDAVEERQVPRGIQHLLGPAVPAAATCARRSPP